MAFLLPAGPLRPAIHYSLFHGAGHVQIDHIICYLFAGLFGSYLLTVGPALNRPRRLEMPPPKRARRPGSTVDPPRPLDQKISRLPPDISSDCRKASSALSPSTTASTSGASG